MTDYRQVIPWHIIKKHLEKRLSEVNDAWLTTVSTDDLHTNKGKALILRELFNLPETLMTYDVQDEQERKEKEHASQNQ